MTRAAVLTGSNLDLLPQIPAGSIDAIVTDPPYGMSFMSRNWDKALPDPRTWAECFRVLKPGGHMVAFGAPRLYHRLAVQIEDSAPWELRDCISWLFGSGFPKSHDVSKAIDKIRKDRTPETLRVTQWIKESARAAGVKNSAIDAAFGFCGMAGHWTSSKSQPSVPTLEQIPKLLEVLGDPEVPPEIAELLIDLNAAKGQPGEAWFRREVLGRGSSGASSLMGGLKDTEGESGHVLTAPATDAAAQWEGWGTALKPAWEPILLARKPLEGTVARNVLAYGTGAMNIDGCRVGTTKDVPTSPRRAPQNEALGDLSKASGDTPGFDPNVGRWPANLILDEEAGAALDAEVGDRPVSGTAKKGKMHKKNSFGWSGGGGGSPYRLPNDSGGPSRFFYCAKASRSEREAGLENLTGGTVSDGRAKVADNAYQRGATVRKNRHPTVKPIALMRWLVRLITPPNGIVLDPFNGSGSTGCAAMAEGFQYLGMELDPEHAETARARIRHWEGK